MTDTTIKTKALDPLAPAIDAALAAFYSQMKFPDRDPARREDMRRAIAAALNKGAP